jgi:hypothetical protein
MHASAVIDVQVCLQNELDIADIQVESRKLGFERGIGWNFREKSDSLDDFWIAHSGVDKDRINGSPKKEGVDRDRTPHTGWSTANEKRALEGDFPEVEYVDRDWHTLCEWRTIRGARVNRKWAAFDSGPSELHSQVAFLASVGH